MARAELDIHVASAEEIEASHRNCYDLWHQGRSLEDHLAFRATAPRYLRATWFAGCVGEQVVTSIAAHPFSFRLRDEVLSGIGVASVYTVAEHRGKGYAPRVLDYLERYFLETSIDLSILFSDLDPGYYGRLGYVLCPAYEGWCGPSRRATPLRCVSFSGAEHVEDMAAFYGPYHETETFALLRDGGDWQAGLGQFPHDTFAWLEDAAGDRLGYARLRSREGTRRIVDFALARRDDALASDAYAALIDQARDDGCATVGGWLPDTAPARKLFDVRPRSDEITMIKPLAWDGTLDAQMLAATANICELDHV